MMYLWTLDSHELYGPFGSRDKAWAYANYISLTSYVIVDETKAQREMIGREVRIIPIEYR